MYKATWSIGKQKLELAVKTLKAGSSEEDKVKFLQEAAIMGQFSHINVIKMYGVVTMGEPVSEFNNNLQGRQCSNIFFTMNKAKVAVSRGMGATASPDIYNLLQRAKDLPAGM